LVGIPRREMGFVWEEKSPYNTSRAVRRKFRYWAKRIRLRG
jgi:hypothetical protein